METLEFKSVADRLIIGVLKSLKFLNDDGSPTNRYFAYLDQTQSAKVLAEGIRDAYADLFQVNTAAQTLPRNDVINKFKTLSQGQLSESVLEKMALTFTELCKLGDFQVTPAQKQELEKEKESAHDETRQSSHTNKGKIKVDGLIYNIQLILPESRDQSVYDALFRSLREHLG